MADGAAETGKELSPEQEKLLEASGAVGIKFVSGAAAGTNGDAKIEVGSAAAGAGAAGLAGGLRKEELLKFANDPFWVRLRWLLFILFWLTWLAMLAGAVYIVVEAPKCPAPEPRLWWEKGQLVVADAAQGLKDLELKLPELSASASGLLLKNVVMKDAFGVVNFQDVNPAAGSLADFKTLAAKAKDQGVRVILEMEINHCSKKHEWFVKSLNKSAGFDGFFVWQEAAGAMIGADGKPSPPTNWLSVSEPKQSAWQYESGRNQFYLRQFSADQPDLNLRNPDVQLELRKVLRFWRGLGVSGFLFQHVSFLLEDELLRNEPVSTTASNATFKDYDFYNHIYTKNLPENLGILSIFKTEMLSDKDEPENKIVFAAEVAGSVNEAVQFYGSERPPVVELPLNRLAAADTAAGLDLLVASVQKAVPAGVWANWLMAPDTSVRRSAYALALALLPGTFIYQPDGPDAQSQTNASDVLNVMKMVQPEREVPSVMYGAMDTLVLEPNVFAYTRKKSGNPGYMVLFNMGSEDQNVTVTSFPDVPESLTLVLRSSPPGANDLPLKSKVDSSSVLVSASTTIVLTFVPQKH